MAGAFPGISGKIVRKAEISPDRVKAGEYNCFTITFTVGEGGLGALKCLAVDFPGNLQVTRPQTYFQEEPGYTTFDFCGKVKYSAYFYAYEGKRLRDPSLEDSVKERRDGRLMIIRLEEGKLLPGDEFRVRFGDNSDGMGPGAMLGIVVPYPGYRSYFNYRVFPGPNLKDAEDGGRFHVSLEPSALRRCVCVPKIRDGRRVTFSRPEDFFGNAVPAEAEKIIKTLPGPKISVNRYGVCASNGSGRCSARDRNIPVINSPAAERSFNGKNIYFGDLHVHTGFSIDVKKRQGYTLSPGEMLDYAKNSELLDFCAITDHHQPWDKKAKRLTESEWAETLRAAEKANEDGIFAAFPGFEFRCVRGDTVVIFGESIRYGLVKKIRECSIEDLWEKLKGKKIITVPHFHNPGRLAFGKWTYNEKFDRLLETHSCHGNFFSEAAEHRGPPGKKKTRADRNALFILKKGYEYGLTASTDDHKGHCGRAALCAVFAEKLTADDIFDGLYNRHVYGTSGERIKLVFSANGKLMGSAVKDKKIEFLLEAEGTDRIREVDFLKNGEVVKRFFPGKRGFKTYVEERVAEPAFYQVNVIQENTHLAWSSPVWASRG